LVSIFAFHNGVLTSTVCGLAAIIFAVFAFVRHAEAKNIESSLDYLSFMKLYAEIMRNRVTKLTSRYEEVSKPVRQYL